MAGQIAIRKIRAQILRMNRRLGKTGEDPSNDDRALLGSLAVAQFASAAGQIDDIRSDPETVLSDLLADLMHW